MKMITETKVNPIIKSEAAMLKDINQIMVFKKTDKKRFSRNQSKKRTKKSTNNISPSQKLIDSLLSQYSSRLYVEAENSALMMTQKYPEYPFGWKVLGAVLDETGRNSEAADACQKALQLAPKDAEVHNNLGKTLEVLGRLREAEKYFKQATALNSRFAQAHSNLGATLSKLGRLGEAEESLRTAIAIKPDYEQANFNLGSALQQLGRLNEAINIYTRVIELNSSNAPAYSQLGAVLAKLGRLDEAAVCYTRAIALAPSDAIVHNNLGRVFEDLGRLDDAKASYMQAIDFQSGFIPAHINLGSTLAKLGRWDESEASYIRATELNPDALKARCNLLKSWYHLDKKALVIAELDSLSKQEKINATIGSITCRSKIKYGHDLTNIFCNNPLQYVCHTDLHTEYEFHDIFAHESKKILKENRVSNKTQPLLVNGHQSSGNIFDLESTFTNEVEKIIRLEIEKYRTNFKGSMEGIITKWPAEYILSGWLISMNNGGALAPHIHEEGWISGCVYINVPPKENSTSGNLVVALGEDNDAIGGRLNVKKMISVITGSLVLFPSSLTHYTIPFQSKENRIVLAFDIIKK